jgi:hypothetical protein
MNLLNNATLEASKRLVEKGIVLETDCYHISVCQTIEGDWQWTVIERTDLSVMANFDKIPAPCMADVWRELPDLFKPDNESSGFLTMQKVGAFTEVGYERIIHGQSKVIKSFENTNPTDALIELRIWLEEQKGE